MLYKVIVWLKTSYYITFNKYPSARYNTLKKVGNTYVDSILFRNRFYNKKHGFYVNVLISKQKQYRKFE